MKFFSLGFLSASFATLLGGSPAHAWDRRGHSIVNTTAAYLMADDTKNPSFYRQHSFDLSYYGNIPDNTWKAPETYDQEHGEHYTDLDVFEAAFKDEGKGAGLGLKDDPFTLSRDAFTARFPKVTHDDGRSFWRIREFSQALQDAQKKLAVPSAALSHSARFNLQAKWLLYAGLMGHYIGDLGQPLHVTRNFDGQATHQNGVHAFFEGRLVDELYPDLEPSVLQKARAEQDEFRKEHEQGSILQLLEWLAKDSEKQIPKLLALDKKIGRTDAARAASQNHDLIVRQLTQSSLVLAEIWRRSSNWNPDNTNFFVFFHKVLYIEPGTSPLEITSDDLLK